MDAMFQRGQRVWDERGENNIFIQKKTNETRYYRGDYQTGKSDPDQEKSSSLTCTQSHRSYTVSMESTP